MVIPTFFQTFQEQKIVKSPSKKVEEIIRITKLIFESLCGNHLTRRNHVQYLERMARKIQEIAGNSYGCLQLLLQNQVHFQNDDLSMNQMISL